MKRRRLPWPFRSSSSCWLTTSLSCSRSTGLSLGFMGCLARSEGVGGRALGVGDPLALRELLEVGQSAEASAVAGGTHATEGHVELGIHRLVVDVHHARGQALGDADAAADVGGVDAGRQAIGG